MFYDRFKYTIIILTNGPSIYRGRETLHLSNNFGQMTSHEIGQKRLLTDILLSSNPYDSTINSCKASPLGHAPSIHVIIIGYLHQVKSGNVTNVD